VWGWDSTHQHLRVGTWEWTRAGPPAGWGWGGVAGERNSRESIRMHPPGGQLATHPPPPTTTHHHLHHHPPPPTTHPPPPTTTHPPTTHHLSASQRVPPCGGPPSPDRPPAPCPLASRFRRVVVAARPFTGTTTGRREYGSSQYASHTRKIWTKKATASMTDSRGPRLSHVATPRVKHTTYLHMAIPRAGMRGGKCDDVHTLPGTTENADGKQPIPTQSPEGVHAGGRSWGRGAPPYRAAPMTKEKQPTLKNLAASQPQMKSHNCTPRERHEVQITGRKGWQDRGGVGGEVWGGEGKALWTQTHPTQQTH
jgi:hypothetical protein